MLLSRLAETMYWLARYVERAEDQSRAIVAHEQLYLDMPKVAANWKPLLDLCGAHPPNDAGLSNATTIVRYLINGSENGASIHRTLLNAKEDLRLSRPLLPKESWQVLSGACDLLGNLSPQVSLTEACRALSRIVEQCQRLTGQVEGCMSRDEAYSFLRMGRLLERADTTLRVVSMLAHVLDGGDAARPFANVRWVGTLRYAAADQMFLRRYHTRAARSQAVKFLLHDRWFPRSVTYCLAEIRGELEDLPNSVDPLAACEACSEEESIIDVSGDTASFVGNALVLVAKLNDAIEATYFHPPPELREQYA